MTGHNFKQADFFPSRLSQYVKGMRYHSQISENGIYIASLGTPLPATVDAIFNNIDGTGTFTTAGLANGDTYGGGSAGALVQGADSNFGRCIATSNMPNPHEIVVYGWDYLGQYMAETIGASATSSAGVKAFKRVEKVVVNTGTLSNADIGYGGVHGLPFATKSIIALYFDEAVDSTSAFTDVVRTDPQTLTTGDPRGTFNPTGTEDGAKELIVIGVADNYVNAAGNGGLHGIAHVFA